MTERERFEKWMASHRYAFSDAKYPDTHDFWPGQYLRLPVQFAWEAWQAGGRVRVKKKRAGRRENLG
jgi:hypothetical protein